MVHSNYTVMYLIDAISGPTPPRLLSVSLDEPSSTATVQWIRPIAGFSSLGQMYYWYLAIYAIKEYRTELGETKVCHIIFMHQNAPNT